MAGAKGAKLANRAQHTAPRRHHCRTHDETCRPIMVMPKRRMRFDCPEGCQLNKGQTILK